MAGKLFENWGLRLAKTAIFQKEIEEKKCSPQATGEKIKYP